MWLQLSAKKFYNSKATENFTENYKYSTVPPAYDNAYWKKEGRRIPSKIPDCQRFRVSTYDIYTSENYGLKPLKNFASTTPFESLVLMFVLLQYSQQ